MKWSIILGVILFFAGCTGSSTQESSTNAGTSPSAKLTGQSGVEDDVSEKNILAVALASKDHTTLAKAVVAAGLQDVLTNAGPLTVFAPTNAAFEKLPEGTLASLLLPENKDKLANIITYHAAPGSYTGGNIRGVMGIGQATGDKVEVTSEGGDTFVNGAKVMGTVKASNGYVHVIDAVLLPPE